MNKKQIVKLASKYKKKKLKVKMERKIVCKH